MNADNDDSYQVRMMMIRLLILMTFTRHERRGGQIIEQCCYEWRV